MTVPMPREKWTDERLDDLNKKVDDGFASVDKDIRELRSDLKDLQREMNERFDSLNGGGAALGEFRVGVCTQRKKLASPLVRALWDSLAADARPT